MRDHPRRRRPDPDRAAGRRTPLGRQGSSPGPAARRVLRNRPSTKDSLVRSAKRRARVLARDGFPAHWPRRTARSDGSCDAARRLSSRRRTLGVLGSWHISLESSVTGSVRRPRGREVEDVGQWQTDARPNGRRLRRRCGDGAHGDPSYEQMTAGGQSFFICAVRTLAPATQAPASAGPMPGTAPRRPHSAMATSPQASMAVVQIARLTELSLGVQGIGRLSAGWPPHSASLRHRGKQSRTRGAQGAMQSAQHSKQARDVRSTAQGRSCARRTPGRTDGTWVTI